MSNPFETKWAKRPTPELVSRLNDLTSLILSEVDEDDEATILGSYNARKSRGELKSQRDEQGDGIAIPHDDNSTFLGVLTHVRDYASEAHWISEELEHRINLTEHAGRLDITISDPHK